MSLKGKGRLGAITEARERFVYVILAMILIAGTTDWFVAVFSG